MVPYSLMHFLYLGVPESVRDLEPDKNDWRAIKKDHLLAYSSLVKLTLASRDVCESRGALERYSSNFSVLSTKEKLSIVSGLQNV